MLALANNGPLQFCQTELKSSKLTQIMALSAKLVQIMALFLKLTQTMALSFSGPRQKKIFINIRHIYFHIKINNWSLFSSVILKTSQQIHN